MRNTALQNKPKTSKKIIPFITTFNPATPNLKKILRKHWHLMAGNHNLAQIFKNPLMVAYHKDKSLKNYLVRARIPSPQFNNQGVIHGRGQVTALQQLQGGSNFALSSPPFLCSRRFPAFPLTNSKRLGSSISHMDWGISIHGAGVVVVQEVDALLSK